MIDCITKNKTNTYEVSHEEINAFNPVLLDQSSTDQLKTIQRIS